MVEQKENPLLELLSAITGTIIIIGCMWVAFILSTAFEVIP